MESTGDKLLRQSIGKNIVVYYNDTFNSVSFKAGKFLDFDENNLKLLENEKKEPTLIPRNKYIRIELGGELAYEQAPQK
jgi:hypothetical protein